MATQKVAIIECDGEACRKTKNCHPTQRDFPGGRGGGWGIGLCTNKIRGPQLPCLVSTDSC
jgi:hypothetical protein